MSRYVLNNEIRKSIRISIHNINYYKSKGDKETLRQELESLDTETISLAHRNMCRKTWQALNRYRRKGGLKSLVIPKYYI